MLPRRLTLEPLEHRWLLTTWHVAPGGSNSNPGTSALPWLTLQHAADQVAAGDTVQVAAGAYAGFDLRTDGTAAQPITFQAAPGAVINSDNSVTPDGVNLEGADHIIIDGFQITGATRAGIRSVINHHVTIRNNVADQNGRWGIFTGFSDDLLIENNVASRSGVEHGIYVSNSGDRPVIRGNELWGNNAAGLHMNGDASAGGDGVISNALVEQNVVYDNGVAGGSGLNADGVQDSIFRNNLLYDNHASGISLYQIDGGAPSTNNIIQNNTIIMASDGRWAVNLQDGASGNTVLNNILYSHHSFRGVMDVSTDSLPGLLSDYNIVMNRFTNDGGDNIMSLVQWQSNTGLDTNSIVATPAELFEADGYKLSEDSPALDMGTLTGAPDRDLEGVARPQGAGIDVGAYERLAGVADQVGAFNAATGQWMVSDVSGADPVEFAKWGPQHHWRLARLGDWDGDGDLDAAAQMQTGRWFLGINDGERFNAMPGWRWSTSLERFDVEIGDFDGDGREDVIHRAANGVWYVSRWDADDGLVVEPWEQWGANNGWQLTQVGDFDGDGRDDIASQASWGWWYVGVSNGDGFDTTPWVRWSTHVERFDVMSGDFNGDGKEDIVGRTASGAWYVAESNGNGFVNRHAGNWSPGVDRYDVQVADFDGDGLDDIIGRTGTGHWYVGESNGVGFETDYYGRWSGAYATAIAGDYDGDGRDDMVGVGVGQLRRDRSDGDAFVDAVFATWPQGEWEAWRSGLLAS